MTIQEFAEMYYNLPDEERNINDWFPVLDGFVRKITNRYDNFEDFEERYQMAWIAAVRAIKKYDLNSNSQFTTYAWLVIANDLNVFYNKNKRAKQKLIDNPTVSIDANIKGDIDNDKEKITLGDLIADNKFQGFDEIFIEETIRELYDACSNNEKEILVALLNGIPRPRVTEALGKSWTKTYIHAAVRNIRNKYNRIIKR